MSNIDEYYDLMDKFIADMNKQRNDAKIKAFVKDIGEMLRKNGVVPYLGEYKNEQSTEKTYSVEYGYVLEELDFTEHDKQLKERIGFLTRKNEKLFDENQELKQRIVKLEKSRSEWIDKTVEWQQKCEKLESKESVKSMRIEFHADNGEMLTPLEVANSLINQNTFKVYELRELAEHLQVYCRHHNDKESETISF